MLLYAQVILRIIDFANQHLHLIGVKIVPVSVEIEECRRRRFRRFRRLRGHEVGLSPQKRRCAARTDICIESQRRAHKSVGLRPGVVGTDYLNRARLSIFKLVPFDFGFFLFLLLLVLFSLPNIYVRFDEFIIIFLCYIKSKITVVIRIEYCLSRIV